MANEYSRTWFELFLETRPFTPQEVAFVQRHLPNPPHKKVLDLCCGQGRITNPLAELGYDLLGVDIDAPALAIAQQNAPLNARYLQQDMRQLDKLNETFDAVLLLWQSFGYFDASTNDNIIGQISGLLRRNGRFILDIYNRAYWQQNQTSGVIERKGVSIQFDNKMENNRLTSTLIYSDKNGRDQFNWQLYTIEEITKLTARHHLQLIHSCVECNDNKPISATSPHMQLAFELIG